MAQGESKIGYPICWHKELRILIRSNEIRRSSNISRFSKRGKSTEKLTVGKEVDLKNEGLFFREILRDSCLKRSKGDDISNNFYIKYFPTEFIYT
jgi:hypothetical protein